MKKLNNYNHIIFDFDGTLWNSEVAYIKSFLLALSCYDLELKDISKLLVGIPIEKNIERNFQIPKKLEKKIATKFRSYFFELDNLLSSLYPGSLETLKILKDKGFKISIASYKQEKLLYEIIEKNFKNFQFDKIKGTNLGIKKSKKEIIQEVLTSREPSIYIGDTEGDYRACEELSLDFIWSEYGYQSVVKNSNSKNEFFIISEIKEIITI